jgi:hypothetical protein
MPNPDIDRFDAVISIPETKQLTAISAEPSLSISHHEKMN